MVISFSIFYNKYDIKITQNDINDINDINNIIYYNIFDWNDLKNRYYLANLVFPEYNSTNSTNSNVWLNLKSRPFKFCPCKYDKLVELSNNSIINIIVRDDINNKIIGFCVISDIVGYYFINILCTNISQGIGTLIIDFVKKNISTNKPIKLESTFNSVKFYLKKGFSKLDNNIMIYSNKN